MNAKTETSLGVLIRLERKKAGLTQAQLGKLIGLGEARISKIENGAPITPEVADYILGKMGSGLQLKVVSKNSNKSFTSFIISVIGYFAKLQNISFESAHQYLKNFNGLDYLKQYFEIERTLSYSDIAQNLATVCENNGGSI